VTDGLGVPSIGFVPLFAPPASRGEGHIVSVRDRGVRFDEGAVPDGALYLGQLDGRACWAVRRDDEADGAFTDLYLLWSAVGEVRWAVAGRAVQLLEWADTHRFCGRCATPTEPAPHERAMRCPSCGLVAFPRLAPAVITLVEHPDGRALLARNVGFPVAMYSCLAGFVEPGETLEQAVAREVREEVGVEVGDITYAGSQPWPFPHSLMIGFTARYRSGEIVCAEDEIADAAWFSRDALPTIPPGISIARRLIDAWLARG